MNALPPNAAALPRRIVQLSFALIALHATLHQCDAAVVETKYSFAGKTGSVFGGQASFTSIPPLVLPTPPPHLSQSSLRVTVEVDNLFVEVQSGSTGLFSIAFANATLFLSFCGPQFQCQVPVNVSFAGPFTKAVANVSTAARDFHSNFTSIGPLSVDVDPNTFRGVTPLSLITKVSPNVSVEIRSGDGLGTGSGTITGRLVVRQEFTPPEDIDDDGIPNDWETYGVTIDDAGNPSVGRTGNGVFIDLNAMGADPLHKDIFVHADWMEFLKPSSLAIDHVIDAFAIAPVINPDGKPGIHLHVDLGPNSKMRTGATWGTYSQAHDSPFKPVLGSFFLGDENGLYLWADFDRYKSLESPDGRSFVKARRQRVFHYALFADYFGTITNQHTGLARPAHLFQHDGVDFIVAGHSLFQIKQPLYAVIAEAATFMHELGHNLGLAHGGNENTPNFKPNYVSVMNYSFCLNGLADRTGRKFIDYSRDVLPRGDSTHPAGQLDENALDETFGINDPAAHLTLWGPHPDIPQTTYFRLFLNTPTPQALDWNLNGNLVPDRAPLPPTNINGDMDKNGNPIIGVLHGFNDWNAIDLHGGGKLGAGAPIPDVESQSVDEPRIDEMLNFLPKAYLQEDLLAPHDVVTVSTHQGQVPLAVSFDASNSTAVEATITDWHWDFGDGSTGTGAMVTHIYTKPDDYYAHVDITDSNGRRNVIPLLQVVLAEAAPTPTPSATPTATPVVTPTATPSRTSTPTPTPAPDTTAPTITNLSASPAVLWPPDNKMVNVLVNYDVTDDRGGAVNVTLSASAQTTGKDANKTGVTDKDFVVVGPHNIQLRAKKGSAYTLTVTAKDDSGNTTTRWISVTVPHDQRPR